MPRLHVNNNLAGSAHMLILVCIVICDQALPEKTLKTLITSYELHFISRRKCPRDPI
ncbi:hypothetical protein M758_9G048300 [Ceratodon purpureus]|nr:hypothetical protein M758_9G048300 [Ceratodon purpureus]